MLIWVEGPDAAGFLHGLLSNEITGLADGGQCTALLLDSTGHLRADMTVVRDAREAFTVITDEAQGATLVGLLNEYLFSEEVEIIGPETFARVTALASTVDAPGSAADVVVRGRVPGTVEVIGADASAIVTGLVATAVPDDELELLRVAAGVPRFGTDVTAANLVHEAGLQHEAVSFDKGCYLGQETVARVEYRGGVNRRLVGLTLAAPVPAGSTVRRADRDVGVLTSIATSPTLGPIALAVLRKEAEVGETVDVAGTGAVVTALPFPDTA